jgi:mono/diheme cytochrome c family protein
MKDSISLGLLTGSLGLAFMLACGPSQPANTGDDGSTSPTASATATTDPAGAAPAGGSSEGGAAPTGGSSEGGGAPTATTSAPVTQASMVAAGDAANGEKLFEQQHCNGCHGTKAKPPGKFPNLFKIKWNDHEYEEAFAMIKKGKTPMPAYGEKLNDKQIADIIAFVKK